MLQKAVEVVSFETDPRTRKVPGERFDLRCPDCEWGVLQLREYRGGFFYSCNRYDLGCRGSHTAKPDGSPRGVPANAQTRRARRDAHQTFDRIWQGPNAKMDRMAAYEWMQAKLFLRNWTTISSLTREQCEQLVELVKREFPEYRTAWDRLGESF